jgi:hypothetical protein
LPAPVQEFVAAFDSVRFPELVSALAGLHAPGDPPPATQLPLAAATR